MILDHQVKRGDNNVTIMSYLKQPLLTRKRRGLSKLRPLLGGEWGGGGGRGEGKAYCADSRLLNTRRKLVLTIPITRSLFTDPLFSLQALSSARDKI